MKVSIKTARVAWCNAFFLILIGSPAVCSQTPAPPVVPTPQPTATPSASPTPSLERRFFKNILRDQRAIWTSPLHLHEDDVKWLVPLGLSTVGLIATDRRTAGALHDNRLRLNISRDVGYLGSGYNAGAIAAAFYLIGRKEGNARLRETGLLGAEALINDGIVLAALKVATERTRPRKDGGRGRFFHGGFSFPSGHAMAAWSMAAIVAQEYRDRPVVQVAAYGLATAVSVSRFTGRNHFLSDVLVGSAIGYGIGRYVYRTHHVSSPGGTDGETTKDHTLSSFPSVIPRYDLRSRSYGITLVWNF